MSDRANGLIVALDRDIRVEDDLQPIVDAIRMIRGVVGVTPNIASSTDWIIRHRAEVEMETKIWDALHGKDKSGGES